MDPEQMLGGQYADIQQRLLPTGAMPGGQQIPLADVLVTMRGIDTQLSNLVEVLKQKGLFDESGEVLKLQAKFVHIKNRMTSDAQESAQELAGATLMGQM